MVKKSSLIIITVIVLILSGLNIFLFLNKGDTSYSGFSGMIVKEPPELPLKLNFSLIAFTVQWIILIFIVIVTSTKFLRHKKDEITKIDYHIIKERKTRSETDLDILYNLLKKRKEINIRTISKIFGISKEKAIEWAKILENHELVTIEYPIFNYPEVKINEKEQTEKEEVEKEPISKKERDKKTELEENKREIMAKGNPKRKTRKTSKKNK